MYFQGIYLCCEESFYLLLPMRGIVQSRPFVRKSQKSFSTKSNFSFSTKKRRGRDQHSFFLLFFKKWSALILVIFLSFFLGIFLLKGTRYNPTYLIKNIEYSETTKKKYWNTELFVLASKFLRGKYYNTLRVGGELQLTDWVKKEYHFVKSAKLEFLGNQTAKVSFDFTDPDFLVKLGDKKFGIWENGVSEELDPNRSLGQTGFIIDTPSYLTGTTSLSGFFYEVNYQRYKDYLPAIQQAFPRMNRFVYLAGSPSFVVFEDNKMIFLYRDDLLHQLQKLAWLQKYYAEYKDLTTIDLWSLTQEKIIVGK